VAEGDLWLGHSNTLGVQTAVGGGREHDHRGMGETEGAPRQCSGHGHRPQNWQRRTSDPGSKFPNYGTHGKVIDR